MRFFQDEKVQSVLGMVGAGAALLLMAISDILFPMRESPIVHYLVEICGYCVLMLSARAIYNTSHK